jgi:hypothetical protein
MNKPQKAHAQERWAFSFRCFKIVSMGLSNSTIIIYLLLLLSFFPSQSMGWGTPSPLPHGSEDQVDPVGLSDIENKWGVKILGIRLTAADKMLDFRYRVVDPEKAFLWLNRQTESYLINQSTGEKLAIPKTKLGPLRQTSVKPLPNRDYFILFANPNRSVKLGTKVTLVLGELKIENLVVE